MTGRPATGVVPTRVRVLLRCRARGAVLCWLRVVRRHWGRAVVPRRVLVVLPRRVRVVMPCRAPGAVLCRLRVARRHWGRAVVPRRVLVVLPRRTQAEIPCRARGHPVKLEPVGSSSSCSSARGATLFGAAVQLSRRLSA